MDIEKLRVLCTSLPHVTEDVKWGNDLCFCIGEKMFCVVGLNQSPTSASFKVTPEEFEELSIKKGFQPAPYVARYKWVLVNDIGTLTAKEWQHYVTQSYMLVKEKLPAKIRRQLETVS